MLHLLYILCLFLILLKNIEAVTYVGKPEVKIPKRNVIET